mgnify:CR=1 FL=1
MQREMSDNPKQHVSKYFALKKSWNLDEQLANWIDYHVYSTIMCQTKKYVNKYIPSFLYMNASVATQTVYSNSIHKAYII